MDNPGAPASASADANANARSNNTAGNTKADSPQSPGTDNTGSGAGMPLPHERDQSRSNVGAEPRSVVAQAKRDLDAGMVDTDMRSTPGLDSQRRDQLVPGTPPHQANDKAAAPAQGGKP